MSAQRILSQDDVAGFQIQYPETVMSIGIPEISQPFRNKVFAVQSFSGMPLNPRIHVDIFWGRLLFPQ